MSNGLESEYWYYCPVCGDTKLPSFVVCPKHKKKLIKSKYSKKYYQDKAFEQGNYASGGYGYLLTEEISKNPLYVDQPKKVYSNKKTKTIYDKDYRNIPKCPTCQSTNIKKVSMAKKAVHGFAFGLFSRTAFSQFECGNCGYKW